MIQELGEKLICEADAANIPILIRVDCAYSTDENDNIIQVTPAYLYASCLCLEREIRIIRNCYKVQANNVEEIQEYVKKHILPLYEVAFNSLKAIAGMADRNEYDLIYWQDPKLGHFKYMNRGEVIGGSHDGEIYEHRYWSHDYPPCGPSPETAEVYSVFSAKNPCGDVYHFNKETKQWIYKGPMEGDEHLALFDILGIETDPL